MSDLRERGGVGGEGVAVHVHPSFEYDVGRRLLSQGLWDRRHATDVNKLEETTTDGVPDRSNLGSMMQCSNGSRANQ